MSPGTPNTRLIAPAGTPALAYASISPAQAAGVSSGPLMMIEQPAASAIEHLRTAWLIGKFHGVKAATGPTGSPVAGLSTASVLPRAAGRQAPSMKSCTSEYMGDLPAGPEPARRWRASSAVRPEPPLFYRRDAAMESRAAPLGLKPTQDL